MKKRKNTVSNKMMKNKALKLPVKKSVLAKIFVPKKRTRSATKKRSLRFVDMIAIIICLAGAFFALFLFWQDLNATLAKQEAPIATISFKKRTAQRRFGDRVAWEMLKEESPIYSGDLIHTADAAEATINFEEQSNIELGENSLIQVFDSGKLMRIDLINGNLTVHTNGMATSFYVVNNGLRVDLDKNSTVSAAAGVGGEAGIQIVSGNANIIAANGETQEAAAGQSFNVNSSGAMTNDASVALLTPRQGQFFLTREETAPVDFLWQTSNFSGGDFARFEIAADQRFTRIMQSVDVRNASSQTARLSPGTYWWRVYAVGSNNVGAPALSQSNKIIIVSAATPKLLSPANGSFITFRRELPEVRLQWTTPFNEDISDSLEEFHVDVSNNLQMENPVLSVNVTGKFLVTNELGEGTWYWRVRPVYPQDWIMAGILGSEQNANTSALSSFAISQNFESIAAPVLITPADAIYVNVESGAANIFFSWKSESNASGYSFEIADNLEFENPLIAQTQKENRFEYNPASGILAPAVYFWRVRWQDSAGAFSPYSQIRYFSATDGNIIFESAFPPDAWTVSDAALAETRFLWKSNLKTENNLEFSTSVNFNSPLLTRKTNESYYQFTAEDRLYFPAGTYYWRVKTLSNDQDFQSAARRFVVRPSQHIELDLPENGAQLNGLNALRNPPVLTWRSSEPLVHSRLIVSTSPDIFNSATPPVLDLENPGRSVSCAPLPEGTYYWTVQATIQGGLDISPGEPFSFRVLPIPRLSAPGNLIPANSTVIGAATLREKRTIEFSWNRVNGANAYIFSIYAAADKNKTKPIIRTQPIRATKWTLSQLAVLDVGDFVWNVEALLVSPEGAIEQRGNTAQALFTIDITIPSNPKLNNEKTYGTTNND
jgi:hypothetical protein